MMELEALQAVLPQIREFGASLVAISSQLPSYGRPYGTRPSTTVRFSNQIANITGHSGAVL